MTLVYIAATSCVEAQTNWSRKTSNTVEFITGAAYGDNVYIAVAEEGVILRSVDGTVWTTVSSGTLESLRSVVFGDGQFVAVGKNGTVLTSSDGLTWSAQTSGVAAFLSAITYGGGQFVAVGGGGTILTSPDAQTWTSRTSLTSSFLQTVSYGDGIYVAAGEGGKIRRSSDGVTWSSVAPLTSDFLTAGGYFDGRHYLAGQNGRLLSSSDGAIWSFENAGTVEWLRGFTTDGTRAVLSGNGGTILSSVDGSAWTPATSGVTTALTGAVFGGDRFVIVGEASGISGVILVSDRDPGIRWDVEEVSVDEDDGSVTLSVVRLGSTAAAATVDFQTADGSALAGSDYTAESGTVSFAIGESQADIVISLANNPEFEALETFNVELSNPDPAALEIYNPTGIFVRIIDAQDSDADFLPDDWETLHFGSPGVWGAEDDPDNDSNTNLVEYQDGTVPDDGNSASYRLTAEVTSGSGSLTINPEQAVYSKGSTVTLTPAGAGDFDFAGWNGDAGGSGSPLVVTMDGDKTIGADFTVSLPDALDEDALVWTTSGTGPAWEGQGVTTFDGEDAGQAGGLTIGQQATVGAVVSGPAEVSFRWKVSTSAFDSFRFFIDGSPKASRSGEADWAGQTFLVGNGQHTLTWTYAKNSAVPGGSNQAWLDTVEVSYGMDIWKQVFFNAVERADPNTSGQDADPDRDGITNLAEYVFGLHPKMPDADTPFSVQKDGSGSVITWLRHKGRAEDVSVVVESTDTLDPGDWDEVLQPEVILQESEGMETLRMVDPETERIFYRLSAMPLP